MNIQTIRGNAKKTLTTSLLAAVLVTVGLTTFANGNKSGEGDKNAEVKYIGSVNGEQFFNVLYANENGARFSIKVQDREGNTLFQGTFNDKRFDKKFKLESEGNTDKLLFTITNYGDNSVQAFEVSTSSRLVEDVEVKALN